jgi:hypothetical protein
MYLDPTTTRLLAAERVSRLHAHATTTSRRREPRRARARIGYWLVGLGLRLAGPSAATEREGLTALPPACV